MMRQTLPRHKIPIVKNVCIVAVVLLVALLSGHALQTLLPSVYNWLYVAAAISAGIILLRSDRFQLDLSKTALILLLAMVACTLIVSLGGGVGFSLIVLGMILTAYAITQSFSFQSIINVYLHMMTIVSAVALVGYVLVQNTSVLNALPTMGNVNDIEFGVGYIFNYILAVPDRNCGMFWEPGLFATHLTFAMVFEMLRPQRTKAWRMFLFSVCIFTANSSAGFVLWFLCMLILMVKGQSRKHGPMLGFFSLILLCAALVFMMSFDTILLQTDLGNNEYLQKLASDNIFDSSRFKAHLHNLEVFAQYPFFGAGASYVISHIKHVADTATTTYLMSVFGLPGLLYTILWIYGLGKLKQVNVFTKILLIVIILLIINKEPHYQVLFTWIVLFGLLKQVTRTRKERLQKGTMDGQEVVG